MNLAKQVLRPINVLHQLLLIKKEVFLQVNWLLI